MRTATALLITILLAGCGFLKRPQNQFYSLTTMPAEGPAAQYSGPPIAINTIELPPGIDRRGIFIRNADHKVEVRGTHQWTAPLEEMVLHTLAFNLANRLPEGKVILPGQDIPATPTRNISVVFEELAPGPDPVFRLDARWTASDAVGTTHHEEIEIPMASLESPAIVDAMGKALATLATRIAAR